MYIYSKPSIRLKELMKPTSCPPPCLLHSSHDAVSGKQRKSLDRNVSTKKCSADQNIPQHIYRPARWLLVAFPANNHGEAWRYLVSTQSIQLELKDHTEPVLQLAQPVSGQGLSHIVLLIIRYFCCPSQKPQRLLRECKSLFPISSKQCLSVAATS